MTAISMGRALGGRFLKVAPWLVLAAFAASWPHAPKAGLSEEATMSPGAFEAKEPGRGRAAAGPARIPLRGWRDILWRTWKETKEDRIQIVAAGVTFYALLAIFPALGAFVSLYGLFADIAEVEKQLRQLSAILPPGAVDLIGEQMLRLAASHGATLSFAFGLGLLLSIWSANAGIKALFDGLNIAYDETEKRGWLRLTATSLAFTAGTVVFLTAVSALLIAIPTAMGRYGYTPAESFWLPFLWAAVLTMAVTAFSLLYRFGPSRAQARWRWITWGGALAALAWLGGSAGFSLYVANFAHYDRTYGPLGAVIGFMVWMWFSILTILMGAELNAEIEHQTAVDTTTGAPAPMGARGAVMADTVGLAATRRNEGKAERREKPVWAALRFRRSRG